MKSGTPEMRQYQRAWIQRVRAEFFEGRDCAICGEERLARLVVVSGIDGKRMPKGLWSRAPEKRAAVLKELDAWVLCKTCMARVTAERRGVPARRRLRPPRHVSTVSLPVADALRLEAARWLSQGAEMPGHEAPRPLKRTLSESHKQAIRDGMKRKRELDAKVAA